MKEQTSAPPIYLERLDDTFARLDTDSVRGLTPDQIKQRLALHGLNQLKTQRTVAGWRKFLAQFNSALVLLLLIAAVISAAVWFYERDAPAPYEAVAIFAIVLLNAALGYIEASRAERAITSLRNMSPSHVTVIRGGESVRIVAEELVPGDLLVVEEGDKIAADARLLQSAALETAEAALTGESTPIPKRAGNIGSDKPLGDRYNMVFAGTMAVRGRGTAIVAATGMHTELGQIATLLEGVQSEQTPLQVQLERTGKILGLTVIGIAIVVSATILLVEHVHGLQGFVEVFLFGVALAVAAVPEGLPTILTMVLSAGVQRLVRKRALVRHLVAVETLGSANVIASDKTGTLTKNEMAVREVLTASGCVTLAPEQASSDLAVGTTNAALEAELDQALTAAAMVNNASVRRTQDGWDARGDPTEVALLVAARSHGIEPERLSARFTRTGEIPFSSERKLMTTTHLDVSRGHTVVFSKGAPDILIAKCRSEFKAGEIVNLAENRRLEILRSTEALANEGRRTIGVGFHILPEDTPNSLDPDEDLERDLVFAGLIGILDPPRLEAKEAVTRARAAGIRAVMITGDHPACALAIAKEVGIAGGGRALTGAEIRDLRDEELSRLAPDICVYARVNPEDKLRIVRALQQTGSVVAMTGDGVNDAPALKAADVGITMGRTGTDVSKDVADIVLTDDNFATIITAVEEGRGIFANIRKFLLYLLSSNIGEVITIFAGVVLARPIGLRFEEGSLTLPLLPIQILWINLATDGGPALALGLDPVQNDLMHMPPRPREEPVINRPMWGDIIFIGILTAASTLAVLALYLNDHDGNLSRAQTVAFTTLMLSQMFNVFNARSNVESAFRNLGKNQWLWVAVGSSILAHCLVLYVPVLQKAFSTVAISLTDWVISVGAASIVLWGQELRKLFRRSRTA